MQLMPGGVAACTASRSADLLRSASSVSSSYALSKWSSIARLLRPVMKIMSVMPAAAASSTAYWISGLSTTGQHLLRARLGDRQEAAAETGDGKHGFGDLFHS